jgi:hypothetical protein
MKASNSFLITVNLVKFLTIIVFTTKFLHSPGHYWLYLNTLEDRFEHQSCLLMIEKEDNQMKDVRFFKI